MLHWLLALVAHSPALGSAPGGTYLLAAWRAALADTVLKESPGRGQTFVAPHGPPRDGGAPEQLQIPPDSYETKTPLYRSGRKKTP